MADQAGPAPNKSSEPQVPETLWQLLKQMVRGIRQDWKRVLLTFAIQSAVIMLFVMFMNTYIIAYLNEGVLKFEGINNPTKPWHYFLRLGQNQASVDMLCLLTFYVLSALYERLRARGIKGFVLDLLGTPKWTARCLSESGHWGLPVLLISVGALLALTLATRNAYLFATLAISLFFSYTMRERNMSVFLAQLTWSDMQRVFRRNKPRTVAPVGPLSLAILGALIGAFLLVFLPGQPYSALVLCAAFVALGILLLQRRLAPRTALFVLGLALAHALFSRELAVVWAHDTGWREGGGTLRSWWNSPGSRDLILSGTRPGLLGILGAVTGGLLSGLGNGILGLGGRATVPAGGLASRLADRLAAAGQYVRDTATYARDFAGAFVGGVYEDFAGAARTIGNAASTVYNGTVRVAGDVYDFGRRAWNDPQIIADKLHGAYTTTRDAVYSAAGWARDTASEIWNNPQIIADTLRGTAESVGNIVSAIGHGIYTTVTDPAKAWQFVKDAAGLTNFENSWDPNRSLLDRLGQVAIGTAKLYGAIVTAGKIGAAAKSGAAKVSAWCQAGGAKGGLLVRRPPLPSQLPVRPGGAYVTGQRPPNLSHISRQSQRQLQRIADQAGVQIHTRPGSVPGRAWVESGRAIPKPETIKAKTLKALDELIGGPKGREGLVGCFKPQLPPKEVMRTLSRDMQRAIVQQARMRNQEWVKYGRMLNQGDFRTINGVVQHIPSGKWVGPDLDILQFRNFNGGPLSVQQENMVARMLGQARGSNVTHEALSTWNRKTSFNPRAASRMIRDASVGGEGVVTFNPNNAPTQSFLRPDVPFY
jgi:hypothetical protein